MLVQIIAGAIAALAGVVHLTAAILIAIDAKAVARSRQKTWPFGAGFWALAVALTGVIGIGVYWLIHCSPLSSIDRGRVDPDGRPKISPAVDDAGLNENLLRIQEQARRRREHVDS